MDFLLSAKNGTLIGEHNEAYVSDIYTDELTIDTPRGRIVIIGNVDVKTLKVIRHCDRKLELYIDGSLTIREDTDLSGVSLVVRKEITARGNLSCSGRIRCKRLALHGDSNLGEVNSELTICAVADKKLSATSLVTNSLLCRGPVAIVSVVTARARFISPDLTIKKLEVEDCRVTICNGEDGKGFVGMLKGDLKYRTGIDLENDHKSTAPHNNLTCEEFGQVGNLVRLYEVSHG